jgi:hypothetical protein
MKTPIPPKSVPLIALPDNAYQLANIGLLFEAAGIDISRLSDEEIAAHKFPDHGIPNPTNFTTVVWN